MILEREFFGLMERLVAALERIAAAVEVVGCRHRGWHQENDGPRVCSDCGKVLS